MAPTVRAASSNQAGTGTAVSVSAPSGTAVGDLVLCVVHCNGNRTIVDNNGATPFTEDLNDYQPAPTAGMTVAVFSRRIVTGDPSTYNFTTGGSDRWGVVAIAIQNPSLDAKYDVSPVGGSAAESGTTITANSVNTTSDSALHLFVGACDGASNNISGTPAGYALVIDQPLNAVIRVTSKTITPPGATGTKTYTFGSSNGWGAINIVVSNLVTAGVAPTPLIPNRYVGPMALRRAFRRARVWSPESEAAAVSETPTPGGAAAQGVAATASVGGSAGGGSGGGTGGGAAAAFTPGGSVAAGTGGTVQADSASPGGAAAAGTAPAPSVTPDPAGSSGGGTGAGANAGANAGGATAEGTTASASVAATPGAATGGATAPGPSVTVSPGGADAQGVAAGAQVTVAAGGATAGGNAPTEGGSGSETPTPGGATAGGNTAGAAVGVDAGSSGSGGTGGGAATTITPGAATGAGEGGGATTTAAAGGAAAQGTAPTVTQSETPTPGSAAAQGTTPATTVPVGTAASAAQGAGPAAAVDVGAGGSAGGGTAPTVPIFEQAGVGGATAGGFSPTEVGVQQPGGSGGRARRRIARRPAPRTPTLLREMLIGQRAPATGSLTDALTTRRRIVGHAARPTGAITDEWFHDDAEELLLAGVL